MSSNDDTKALSLCDNQFSTKNLTLAYYPRTKFNKELINPFYNDVENLTSIWVIPYQVNTKMDDPSLVLMKLGMHDPTHKQ